MTPDAAGVAPGFVRGVRRPAPGRALAADPANAATHNQLKLCYQRLQRVPEARREEAIGRYLAQENGLTTRLVPVYLQNPAHAADRRAARPFPEHLLRFAFRGRRAGNILQPKK